MKIRRFGSLTVLLVVTAALAGGGGAPPPTIDLAPDDYRAAQAKAQAEQPRVSSLRRTLNFAPFQTALQGLAPRQAELEGLIGQADAARLGSLQTAGNLTSETLTTYYLSRIQRYNGPLGSVLELNPRALEEARQLDEERRAGQVRSPLHGLAVLLKDNVAAAGMHNTAGAAVLRNHMPDQDAFLTRRLREAGLVILGKTNLSEWANFMSAESINGYSVLGGYTRNPYGRFDVGGSSSGSAVAAAANFATFAVGTETWGSLIYPAGQNAVVSLKPTLGLVSRDRIIPITAAQDTAGPMTRTVADLNLIFTALVGQDAQDADTSIAPPYVPPAQLDAAYLRGKRVGLALPDKFPASWRQDIETKLSRAGATVVPIRWRSGSEDPLPVLFYGMKADLESYMRTAKAPVKTLTEIVAFNKADAKAHAPYGQEILEETLKPGKMNPKLLTQAQYTDLVARNRASARGAIDNQLKQYGVDMVASVSNSLSMDYASAGYPALSVPGGYLPSGEPWGLTFVGTALSDARLIQAAYAFEQANPVRQAPVLK